VLDVVEPAPPPTIAHVEGGAVRNDGPHTIAIFGTNLSGPGLTVELERGPTLLAPISTAPGPGGSLQATFDFSGAAVGYWELHVINPGGSDALLDAVVVYAEAATLFRSTTSADHDTYPALAPPVTPVAQDLAFVSERSLSGDPDLHLKMALDPDVDPAQPLTFGEPSANPVWSPDGQWIAYDRHGNELVYFPLDPFYGSSPVPIRTHAVDPTWAPDSDRLAYVDLNGGIFTCLRNGASPVQLSTPGTGGPVDHSPAYSPDGARIAFMRQDGPLYTVHVMDATLGEAAGLATLVPASNVSYQDLAWSPDGRWIAARRTTLGDQADIVLIDARGSSYPMVEVTTDLANDRHPAWSADGTQLAFSSNRAGNYDVYIATGFLPDADGDGVLDAADACPLEAPVAGEIDRDQDGCPDETSSFRFARYLAADRLPVFYETTPLGDPAIADGSEFVDLEAGFEAWAGIPGIALSGGDDGLSAAPETAGTRSPSPTRPAISPASSPSRRWRARWTTP
jgi:hypothetical protein